MSDTETTDPEVYAACPIKRKRSTKAEIAALKYALYEIVEEQQPMSVRQVFYQAVCRGLIDKTEAGYNKIQRALVEMRMEKYLPFDWIADYTRYRIKPNTFEDISDALAHTAQFYRRDLWAKTDAYVEIWCEKAALLGVLDPVTDEYNVSLMITRGFSSVTFLQQAACFMEFTGKPCYIYQFGDHDPSGVSIAESTEARLHEFAPGADIHFERVAVLPWQIDAYDLPTRPTKKSDSRAKNFEGDSVELDAIPPDQLRALVRNCIEWHIDHRALENLKAVEAVERNSILEIAQRMGAA